MRRLSILAVALVTSATLGCAVMPPSRIAYSNSTVPIALGPVSRLDGAADRSATGMQGGARLRTAATNLYRYNSNGSGGGMIFEQTEDASKFDVAVDEALGNCLKCDVHVERIFFGSHSAVLLGTSDDTHWTGSEIRLVPRGGRSK